MAGGLGGSPSGLQPHPEAQGPGSPSWTRPAGDQPPAHPPNTGLALPLPQEAGLHPTGPVPHGPRAPGPGLWPGHSGRPPPEGRRASAPRCRRASLVPPRNRAAKRAPGRRAGPGLVGVGQGSHAWLTAACGTEGHQVPGQGRPPPTGHPLAPPVASPRSPQEPRVPSARLGPACAPFAPPCRPGVIRSPAAGAPRERADGCRATHAGQGPGRARQGRAGGREQHAQMWGGLAPAQELCQQEGPAAWTSADEASGRPTPTGEGAGPRPRQSGLSSGHRMEQDNLT